MMEDHQECFALWSGCRSSIRRCISDAATLADKFAETEFSIQQFKKLWIIGSTVGMSAVD